jgi:hypothetical protein
MAITSLAGVSFDFELLLVMDPDAAVDGLHARVRVGQSFGFPLPLVFGLALVLQGNLLSAVNLLEHIIVELQVVAEIRARVLSEEILVDLK